MGFIAGPTISQPSPVLITATFEILSADYSANIRLRSNNSDALTITIIHENANGATVHNLAGYDTSSALIVEDRQTLTVLARGDEGVEACAIYEVDLAQAERIGAILVPRCVSNIILDHNEAVVATTHSTQPLDETSEQALPETEARIAAVEVR